MGIRNGKLLEPIRLEDQLEIHNLQELMYRFKSHLSDPKAVKAWKARRGSRGMATTNASHVTGLMTMQEFRDTLADILVVDAWDSNRAAIFEKEMETLFKKVDIASDGMVDWDEFCTYMMIQLQEHDESAHHSKGPFNPKPNIARIAHNKETTTTTLTDFNPMRYVTVSKEGIIGVWSTELQLQRTIEMEGRSHQDKASNKRHIRMWITDAVTMDNVHKMVIGTTNMDLYFYDMSTPTYTPQYHLCALGNVPLCLNYYCDPKSPNKRSMLFYGTDNGSLHVLVFSTPVKGLFETPFKKTSGSHKIYFQDISLHSLFVTHLPLGVIHSDWVRRVQYIPVKEFVISCSCSSHDSLVVRDVDDKKRKTYVFKVAKGVDCFDYNHSLNVIITGGVDHAVRVWNPYVTSKPVAIMKGHSSSIVDLVIHPGLEQVFSYDKEGVLKCWNVKEQVCIQTLAIRDPFGHRVPEHGPFPFRLIRSPVSSLLITSNDSLIEIKLVGLGTTKSLKTTHAKPLCAAIYNPEVKQVITGCEGSVISFWDIETGNKFLQVPEAHGTEEISCMHLDQKGSRLMTGDRNGAIRVWNANNGHLLNELEAVEEQEVTGITALPAKHKILTVGWNRKIVIYYDDKETFVIRPDVGWKGGQVHQDDILASAYCSPNLLATGSFDGDIILWNLDREKMIRILKKGSRSLFKSRIEKLGMLASIKEKQKLRRKETKGGCLPVDTLLFLSSRAQWKTQDSAILVSSESGSLEFWCLYGAARPMGMFYAASEDSASVLALATDPSNDILVSGDSAGRISVWDITSYCISRAESIIAQVWSTTQRMSSTDDSPEGSPPCVIKWHAHGGAVVSLEVVSRDEKLFLVSSSVDCTARLWTLDGKYVGMFGQQTVWDIDDTSTYRYAECEPWDESEMADLERSASASPERGKHDDVTTEHHIRTPSPMQEDRQSPSPNEEGEPRESLLPKLNSGSPETSRKDSWRTGDYYRSTTSLVLNRSSKNPDAWSILGHKYNDDFRQRMQTRQSRRDHHGHVDRALTNGAGLGNKCSPFQALHIPNTQEFTLPADLPVTRRMLQKSQKAHAEPFWGASGLNQGSLPALPAIRRSDSFMTVASVNRDSRSQMHSSDTSQFS
ncbi:WD repeat-containing protein on Y chromosome isoform X3 [Nematostella vectensis]|uniref:WD repeat-containing protein on Y chromosome isoform X3 n=1 Tax=Nematostella vectensis TaxID=45351 RepID=UPI002076FA1C|nr:WD repeat-containing protein on Y chromosome isoform X3 [Nematostella vectensis]